MLNLIKMQVKIKLYHRTNVIKRKAIEVKKNLYKMDGRSIQK